MESKFPFSMENIPRQKSFACLSLRFGSIVSGLLLILYSILALAQCSATLGSMPSNVTSDDLPVLLSYSLDVGSIVIHVVTLFLTTVMVIGVVREKTRLIKPWVVWSSMQVMAAILLFIFWTATSVINQMSDSSLIIYVVEFLILVIRFYILMVVASYYKELEEERDERLKNLISSDTWYSAV